MNSPFTLVSCILGIFGWITTFIGLCISYSLVHATSWWIIIFELLTILLSCMVFWTNTVHIYYPVVLCFIAISFPYCTSEVFLYIVMGKTSLSAASAGYIIMMITQFIWIFLYGVQEEVSILRSFNDLNNRVYDSNRFNYQKELHCTLPISNNNITDNICYPSNNHDSVLPTNAVFLHDNIEYSIPVVALHQYNANKEDPNELSFSKGEIIYVHQKRGSWWQAKKSNGEIGMIPSNYVKDQESA